MGLTQRKVALSSYQPSSSRTSRSTQQPPLRGVDRHMKLEHSRRSSRFAPAAVRELIRYAAARRLLAGLLAAVIVMTGCARRKMAAGIGEIVIEKVATQVLLPPFVLALTAGEFHQAFDRWPTNYTELSAYSQSARGLA